MTRWSHDKASRQPPAGAWPEMAATVASLVVWSASQSSCTDVQYCVSCSRSGRWKARMSRPPEKRLGSADPRIRPRVAPSASSSLMAALSSRHTPCDRALTGRLFREMLATPSCLKLMISGDASGAGFDFEHRPRLASAAPVRIAPSRLCMLLGGAGDGGAVGSSILGALWLYFGSLPGLRAGGLLLLIQAMRQTPEFAISSLHHFTGALCPPML
eukprot:scaffold10715_cov114-Isochrysis_galbana.AAC.22